MAARKSTTPARRASQKVKAQETESSVSESRSEEASREEQSVSEEASEEESVSGSEESGSSEKEEAPSNAESEDEKEDEEEREKKTIFVKGLAYEATEEDVRKLFSRYGGVADVRMPKSKDGLKGKGFAYVEFKDLESAQKSFAATGEEVGGRKILVDLSKGGPRKQEGEKPAGRPREGVSVFIGNVPFEFEREDLLDYLKTVADVKDLRVPTDRETNRPKGFAFAAVASRAEADKLTRARLEFGERTLRAQLADQGNGRQGGFHRGGRPGQNDSGKRFMPRERSENFSDKKHVKFE